MATADEVTRSANILGIILKDPNKIAEITSNPSNINSYINEAIDEADKINKSTLMHSQYSLDSNIYRVAIVILGLAILMTIGGGVVSMILVAWNATSLKPAEVASYQGISGVPESLVAIASTAVGALAGLLAPLGGRK